MMNVLESINNIQSYINQQEEKSRRVAERNCDLIKVLATIRTNLERSLKDHKKLNEAVYESIDLCRKNLIYTEMSTGINKIDPPLKEEEKTLPKI
jgi:hypothetical protein